MKSRKNQPNSPGGELIIYKFASGPKLQVRLEKETIWLNQSQIAELFGTGNEAEGRLPMW